MRARAASDAPTLRSPATRRPCTALDGTVLPTANRSQREVNLAGLLRSGLLKRFESSAHCVRADLPEDGRRATTGFLAFLDVGHVPEPEALTEWLAASPTREYRAAVESAVKREQAARSPTSTRRPPSGRSRATAICCSRSPPRPIGRRPMIPSCCRLRRSSRDRRARPRRGLRRRRRARQAQGPRLQLLRRHGRLDRTASSRNVSATRPAARGVPRRASPSSPATTRSRRSDATRGVGICAGLERGASGPRRRPLRHPRDHRRPRRGRQPPAGTAHHQLRPALEPDAPGPAPRPDRPHRLAPRPRLHPLLLPRPALDALLGLEERLKRKIAQAAAASASRTRSSPAPRRATSSSARPARRSSASAPRTRRCSRRAARRDAHTGEEYRQDLRAALEPPARRADQDAALGLRQRHGRHSTASTGFVFCARVGDHPLVQFRYVSLDGAEAVWPATRSRPSLALAPRP